MGQTMMRTLGRSGIQVSALGLGSWAIGGDFIYEGKPAGWGQVDDSESVRAIERALELGITFFDTADVYGCGHSERVLGKALAEKRSSVTIATKFGNLYDEETRRSSGNDASPAYIHRACEASLRRLNTDYIDLYQLHIGLESQAQAEEVVNTLEGLVEEGKIRFYGPSTDATEFVPIFARGPHCTAVQLQFNVFGGNGELLALNEAQGLASVCRTPLAMGLLTGKYNNATPLPADDVRRHTPFWDYFKEGHMEAWLAKVQSVREILTADGRTLAQGALAWLWARSEITIPIAGFKTVRQIEENAGAMNSGPLKIQQMEEIARLLR